MSVSPAMALFPLRLFLGVTFVYAGIQKLSDPGFLHPGAPTYIGTQLHGFATGTPGRLHPARLRPAASRAGRRRRRDRRDPDRAAGHRRALHPGRRRRRDGAQLPALPHRELAHHALLPRPGPRLHLRLAAVRAGRGERAARPRQRRWRPSAARRGAPTCGRSRGGRGRGRRHLDPPRAAGGVRRDGGGDRRHLGAGQGHLHGAAHAGRGLLAGRRRIAAGGVRAAAAAAAGGAAPAAGQRRGLRPAARSSSVPSGAVKLGPANRLPSGQAATYSDPADGSPDILIRESDGSLKAFSAVCTHAGCTVGYEGGTIVCPCHGGEYNAETGEVIAGPPPSGLAPKKVLEAGGQIYAVPS